MKARALTVVAVALVASLFVTSGAVSAWAPGDAATLSPVADGTSCSVHVTRGRTETIPNGQKVTFFGRCYYGTGTASALGAWMSAGRTFAVDTGITKVSFCRNASGCGAGSQAGYRSPPAGSATLSDFTTSECPGIEGCALYRVEWTAGGNSSFNTLFFGAAETGYMQFAGAPGVMSPYEFLPQYGSGTFAPPVEPKYYFTGRVPPPVFMCGTDGTTALVDTPRPKATGIVDPTEMHQILPGKTVNVSFAQPVATGQVWAKFADEPETAWVALQDVLLDKQEVRLTRSVSSPPVPRRNVVFRCQIPGDGGYLYSSFVPYGETGQWQTFLNTSAATRACAHITPVGLPRKGIKVSGDTTFLLSTDVDYALGDVQVTWDWQGESGSFTASAYTVGSPRSVTIPFIRADMYYERLSIRCIDEVGGFTISGSLAGTPDDPLSLDLFPDSRNIDECFDGQGFGLNPASWVPAALRTSACIVTVLFVPTQMDMDALRRRLTGGAQAWLAPINSITIGVGSLASAASGASCSYTVTLPINGGLPLEFDSCTGGGQTARQLVYTVSSVTTVLWGAVLLRRKAEAVLTLNASQAAAPAGSVAKPGPVIKDLNS